MDIKLLRYVCSYLSQMNNAKNMDEFLHLYDHAPKIVSYALFQNQGSCILKRGSIVYRISEYGPDMPPVDKQKPGRFNDGTFPILYVGIDVDSLEDECRLKVGDHYTLHTYEVTEDIELGMITFDINCPFIGTFFQKLCQAKKHDVLPFNCHMLMNLMDYYIGQKNKMDYRDYLLGYSFYLGYKYGKDVLYHYTNKFFKQTIKKYPDGLRYITSFMPVETQLGNVIYYAADYNEENPTPYDDFNWPGSLYALTESGASKIIPINKEERVREREIVNFEVMLKVQLEQILKGKPADVVSEVQ